MLKVACPEELLQNVQQQSFDWSTRVELSIRWVGGCEEERKFKHSKDSKEDETNINAEHQVTTIQNYKINGELWRRQTGIVGFWPKSQRKWTDQVTAEENPRPDRQWVGRSFVQYPDQSSYYNIWGGYKWTVSGSAIWTGLDWSGLECLSTDQINFVYYPMTQQLWIEMQHSNTRHV